MKKYKRWICLFAVYPLWDWDDHLCDCGLVFP